MIARIKVEAFPAGMIFQESKPAPRRQSTIAHCVIHNLVATKSETSKLFISLKTEICAVVATQTH